MAEWVGGEPIVGSGPMNSSVSQPSGAMHRA